MDHPLGEILNRYQVAWVSIEAQADGVARVSNSPSSRYAGITGRSGRSALVAAARRSAGVLLSVHRVRCRRRQLRGPANRRIF